MCAVATPQGCIDGAQIAMEIRITQPRSAPEVLVYSYLDGFCVRLILRTRYAPGSTDIYCGGIGSFYLRGSCGPQSLQGVQSVPRHKISYRGRSLKDRIVTIVSLTRVLVSCVVGVWLGIISVGPTTVRESATPHSKENKQADAGTRLFSTVFSVRRVVMELFIS